MMIQSALSLALLACLASNATNQQGGVDALADAASRHQAQIVASEKAIAEFKLKYEEFERSFRSAFESVRSTKNGKPVMKDEWKSLAIGEFESDDDFQKRQAAARKREEELFETTSRRWSAQLASQERDLEKFVHSSRKKNESFQAEAVRLDERLRASSWHMPSLPTRRRSLDRGIVTLPRFDRETLSFWPVAIPAADSFEARSSLPGNLVVRIEESATASIRVTLPTLAAAQAFKEAFEAGQITCIVDGCLDMGPTESPILVKPEVVRYEEGVDYGAAALALGATLLHIWAGSSPEDLERALQSQAAPSPKLVKVVEQAEVKEAGTRFHFEMAPKSVSFVDSSRRPIRDVRVTFLGARPTVKAIRPDAQKAIQLLQVGDQIIRVGDRETFHGTVVRALCRSYEAGQSFEVTYRRAGSDADLTLKAEGGRPLGIELQR